MSAPKHLSMTELHESPGQSVGSSYTRKILLPLNTATTPEAAT
jgi:hypothetical protein